LAQLVKYEFLSSMLVFKKGRNEGRKERWREGGREGGRTDW
jgi:hypothetical protein